MTICSGPLNSVSKSAGKYSDVTYRQTDVVQLHNAVFVVGQNNVVMTTIGALTETAAKCVRKDIVHSKPTKR